MKKLLLLITLPFCFMSFAQDTFSIVAADSTTREVGSAGASCVDLFTTSLTDDSFLGDLLPDTGAINTQASYLPLNQNNARARMRLGNTPQQIITWLQQNDAQNNPNVRQYGVVGFNGTATSAAGHTGTSCLNYKNHVTGSINGIYYSIQGNILLGQQILDSMEARFRNATGNLACRLMAALQGANVIGADTRCTTDGTSSLFAFVKVAQPTDAYGFPSFKLSVRTHDNSGIEPIDSLQTLFNAQVNCTPIGLAENKKSTDWTIYPNPASNEITIKAGKQSAGTTITLSNVLGQVCDTFILKEGITVCDLSKLKPGVYFLHSQKNRVLKFIKAD